MDRIVLFAVVGLSLACSTKPNRAVVAPPPPRTTVVAVSSAGSPWLDAAPPGKRDLLRAAVVREGDATTARGHKLRGPCWDAVKHATIVNDLVDEAGVPYVMPRDLALDLDGDGAVDPVLEVDRTASGARYELYVRRGNCAHHVGSLSLAGDLRDGGGFEKGLRTLELVEECREGTCCEEISHARLAWDGAAKWVVSSRWTTANVCAP